MIDNLAQALQLMERMQATLPIDTMLDPPSQTALRSQLPAGVGRGRCKVTEVHYIGDEGGIVCGLDFGVPDANSRQFISITHLAFAPPSPLWREILDYQKHRTKRLLRLRRTAP